MENKHEQHSGSENESIASLISKAVRHHGFGELSKAEALYKRILVKDPDHLLAMKKYGVLAFQLGDYLLAEQLFDEAYAMAAFDEQLTVNLVLCKMKLDKLADALPLIQIILQHNPDNKLANRLRSEIALPASDLVE